MRTGINPLFIPGPTNVPEAVRQAMNVPMQDQRGDTNEGMCLTAIALAEICLNAAGAKIAFGSGVAAAQAVYSRPIAPFAALAAE